MTQVIAYVSHLLSAFALLGIFFLIYTKITPFDEIALIRKGDMAAAFSLGGAMLGFSFTLASSILHNDTYLDFMIWGVSAMVVQAIVYAFITRMIPQMNEALEHNNVGMGILMGTISLTVGWINAACLS